jgi:spore germination protein YaaH
VPTPDQQPAEGIYIPNGEEIKLASRSVASMPYDVIKRRNTFVYEDKDEK